MTLTEFQTTIKTCHTQAIPRLTVQGILGRIDQIVAAYSHHIDADAIAYCVPEGFVIESFQRFVDPTEADFLGVRLCDDASKVLIRWTDLAN